MSQAFEVIRNAKGDAYKLTGELSDSKTCNVSLIPKSRLVYVHINDNAKTKSVSISLPEAINLRALLTGMDTNVSELLKSAPAQGARKRKNEQNQNDGHSAAKKRKLDEAVAETEAMLVEFDNYQGQNNTGYGKETTGADSRHLTGAMARGYNGQVNNTYDAFYQQQPAASGYQQYEAYPAVQNYWQNPDNASSQPPASSGAYPPAQNYGMKPDNQQPASGGYEQYQTLPPAQNYQQHPATGAPLSKMPPQYEMVTNNGHHQAQQQISTMAQYTTGKYE